MAGMARKGARSRGAIAPELLADLNTGRVSAATLAECLTVDHAALMRAVVPGFDADALSALDEAFGAGITRRMALAADTLLAHLGPDAAPGLAGHVADTVRGWAAFMMARAPGLTLAERLDRLRPLADDPHFGVREWAWLAVRPDVSADIEHAIDLLRSWTGATSPYVRRFAVEATRPRGVWSAHIPTLKADPAPYVQDVVANWINDAAKDRPDWARALCDRWRGEASSAATARICRRALRSIEKPRLPEKPAATDVS